MTAPICPDCGEEIPYRSCQQPDTEAIAELVLLVHRRAAHGSTEEISLDAFGRAFFQSLDAREAGSA